MSNILLTGSTGFLASYLNPLLNEARIYPYHAYHQIYDLTTQRDIDKLFIHSQPDIVIHLAADVGGLQYNLDNPASIFYNNVMMNTKLIQSAAMYNVKKFIFVSSACAYPLSTPFPIREDDLWLGYPESSNGSYGISKRIALTQLQACKKQWGMKFEYPILANLYGVGDKSDHAIPMLVEKFKEAIKREDESSRFILGMGLAPALIEYAKVEIWGDGTQTRDFLHVKDAARAIKMLLDTDIGEPINIASGQAITIKQVVDYLAEYLNYKGTIVYNTDKPVGQKHRLYDITRAKELLGWQPEISIEDGLREICKSL